MFLSVVPLFAFLLHERDSSTNPRPLFSIAFFALVSQHPKRASEGPFLSYFPSAKKKRERKWKLVHRSRGKFIGPMKFNPYGSVRPSEKREEKFLEGAVGTYTRTHDGFSIPAASLMLHEILLKNSAPCAQATVRDKSQGEQGTKKGEKRRMIS